MRKLTQLTLLMFAAGSATGCYAESAEKPAPAAGEGADNAAVSAVLYKNPSCGCCESYAEHLREHGFQVSVESSTDMPSLKQAQGVPAELASCHTVLIDGYVVEGHVPLVTVDKLLAERPDIDGIALPGMPIGSPGMPGPKAEPFTIFGFSDDGAEVYAVE